MKSLYTRLCTIVWIAISTQAWSQVEAQGFGCTHDSNAGGHTARCLCPEPSAWNEQLGACLEGENEAIVVQGILRTDIMAIGGETTGTVLETAEGSYELVMTLADQERWRGADGHTFQVSGIFVLRHGVERPCRPTIIVESMVLLE